MTKLIETSPNLELKNGENTYIKEPQGAQNADKATKKSWRKLTTVTGTGILLALAYGCGMQPPLEEGVVFEKHHESGHSEEPFGYYPEHWRIVIAKCPQGVDPIKNGITKGCRISSIRVKEKIYNELQIGQNVDFKKPK